MRGCMDRFLLFGLDPDIRKAISNLENGACMTMARELLNLVSITEDVPLVLMCSCVGNLCNEKEVQAASTTSTPGSFLFAFILLTYLLK
jgi:hypothetical protein